MLAGEFLEAKANVISLPEMSEVLSAMVHYLYNFSWKEIENEQEVSKPVYCVQVYQVADKVRSSPKHKCTQKMSCT